MDKQIIDKLKYMINKKKTFNQMKEDLGLEDYEIYGLVYLLNENGFPCKIIDNDIVKMKLPKIYVDGQRHIDTENKEEFCFISDIHYASIFDRPDLVKKIYDECDYRSVTTIFCCGDITDGYYPIRKNHENYLKAVNADSQIEYVVNTHPYNPNIKMYFITGNHDITHKYNENVDIGKKISLLRSDMIYLGHEEADVKVDKLKIKLFHGKSQHKTLLSSNAEKYLDNMKDCEKPDILQLGHIHRSFYMRDEWTNVLQTGSLLDQTPYLTNQRIKSERSCWFVKVEYDNKGLISNIYPEFYSLGDSLVRRKKK